MPMGPFEQQIRNLERLTNRLLADLARLAARIAAVEQSLWQNWGGGGTGGGGGGQLQPVVLSANLPAGTLGSPSGPVSGTLWTEAGGNWVAGPTVDVKSTYSSAVASGKTAWCQQTNGTLYAITADC